MRRGRIPTPVVLTDDETTSLDLAGPPVSLFAALDVKTGKVLQ